MVPPSGRFEHLKHPARGARAAPLPLPRPSDAVPRLAGIRVAVAVLVHATLALATVAFAGCARDSEAVPGSRTNAASSETGGASTASPDTAVFAGGCFWCMEAPFDAIEGVLETTSGYAGGEERDPTYQQVSAGRTGHLEVVRVLFDPARVDYGTLLHVFWRNVDPLDDGGQFCDRGRHYTTAIFAMDEEQERLARASREEIARRFEAPVVTPIITGAAFYPAEEYHQDYYRKNPVRYRFYRWNCGRDSRLEELWGEEAGAKVPAASSSPDPSRR